MHPQRFWLIWITIAAAAIIYVMWPVGKPTTPMSRKATGRPITLILTWRKAGTARAIMALALLASYIAIILVWEDFAYYDDSMLIASTLKGHDISLSIWPAAGRFFPLAFQEFNLIRHFTDTATGYHVLPIAQLRSICPKIRK
jgi:hypothetical protein